MGLDSHMNLVRYGIWDWFSRIKFSYIEHYITGSVIGPKIIIIVYRKIVFETDLLKLFKIFGGLETFGKLSFGTDGS